MQVGLSVCVDVFTFMFEPLAVCMLTACYRLSTVEVAVEGGAGQILRRS